MRSVFVLALAVAAQAATIELSGLYGPVAVGTGESVLLEYQTTGGAEKWPDLIFARFSAATPAEVDYAATALHIQLESLDGSTTRDLGTHQMQRHHYYSHSQLTGITYYDFYAGKLLAQTNYGESIVGIMDGEQKLRVRLTNVGIPLVFGHGDGGTGPLNFLTWGVSLASSARSSGGGNPDYAWLITPEQQSDPVPTPEPGTWALMTGGLALLLHKRARGVRIAERIGRHGAQ